MIMSPSSHWSSLNVPLTGDRFVRWRVVLFVCLSVCCPFVAAAGILTEFSPPLIEILVEFMAAIF